MDNIINIINSTKFDKIHGWCSKEKAIKMTNYIDDNFNLCVELGVFAGKSLLPIALKSKGTVIGIDSWNKSSSLEGTNSKINDDWWSNIDYNFFYNYTSNLLKEYKCNNVKLFRLKSVDAIYLFEDNTIDFLHQDSNHSEEISCNEVELYHNKVKLNGIWVFDDTNWETTKKAQNLLINYGYVELYDSGTYKIYKRINLPDELK